MPLEQNIKNAQKAGFYYGYSQCVRIIFIGFVFYIGTLLLGVTPRTPQQMFTAINIMQLASQSAGMAAANVPSMARARDSAKKIFAIIDEKSNLDVREGKKASI